MCARYDRILVRSKHWSPSSASIFGTEPVVAAEGLASQGFLSDHFGLLCELSFTAQTGEIYTPGLPTVLLPLTNYREMFKVTVYI